MKRVKTSRKNFLIFKGFFFALFPGQATANMWNEAQSSQYCFSKPQNVKNCIEKDFARSVFFFCSILLATGRILNLLLKIPACSLASCGNLF